MVEKKPPRDSLEIPSGVDTSEGADEDFYLDEVTGLMIFTSSYHLRRGYCCENGCRHCPYKK